MVWSQVTSSTDACRGHSQRGPASQRGLCFLLVLPGRQKPRWPASWADSFVHLSLRLNIPPSGFGCVGPLLYALTIRPLGCVCFTVHVPPSTQIHVIVIYQIQLSSFFLCFSTEYNGILNGLKWTRQTTQTFCFF